MSSSTRLSSSSTPLGDVYSWGLGKSFPLGNGSEKNQHVPELVSQFRKKNIKLVQIETGNLFSAALADNGEIFTWGSGKHARLGHSDEENQKIPKKIEIITKYLNNSKIVKISCGIWHAAAMDSSGMIFSWGYWKGTGHGKPNSSSNGLELKPISTISNAIDLSCGHHITIILTGENKLYLCGKFHECGEEGSITLVESFPLSTQEDAIQSNIHSISCGYQHILFGIHKDVWVWGSSKEGALGLGKNVSNTPKPSQIPSFQNAKIKQVSCSVGEHHVHSAAVTENGELWTWGNGYKGKLGHGEDKSCFSPKKVETISSRISHVSCGGIHTTAITEHGELFTWGCGSDGRLGHPEVEGHRYLYRESLPRIVDTFQGKVVKQVSSSYYHNLALVE